MSEAKKDKGEAALQRRGGEFVALANRTETVDLLVENFGPGASMSPWDLQRIRIPAGGGQAWEVQGLDGPQITQQLEAVVLIQRPGRAFWRNASPDNSPPDCTSMDARTGMGDPGGDCAACPYNQWGSDPRGERGKACKELCQLFLLRPEDRLPSLLTLPPTSLRPWRQYTYRLTNAGLLYYAVLTSIGLTQETNKDGQKYSKIVLSVAARLPDEEVQAIRELRAAVQPMLTRVQITGDDYPADE